MTRLIDLTGQKFGILTVIERGKDAPRGKNRLRWRCKCDCGGENLVRAANLKAGHTKSCGCLRKFKDGIASFNRLLNHYKMNAKKKGRVFELTKEEFKIMTNSNCHYCGTPPYNFTNGTARNNGGIYYNGVDRVDSSLGYVTSNCVPCCSICNYAKRDYSLDKFLDWIIRAYKNTRRLNDENE